MIERRDFITGMLAGAGFASGCRLMTPFAGGGSARLKFGVVSDVHVKLAADGRSLAEGYDTQTLERTFTYFRDCGVDAVMIAGDIADIGFVSELKAVADTWFKVFPGDRAPDGRKVELLSGTSAYTDDVTILSVNELEKYYANKFATDTDKGKAFKISGDTVLQDLPNIINGKKYKFPGNFKAADEACLNEGIEVALEVFLIRNRLAYERTLHHEGVEEEVAEEHSERENEDGCIWSSLSCCRSCEVVEVHGSCDESVEECHEDTCYNCEDDTLLAVLLLFFIVLLYLA